MSHLRNSSYRAGFFPEDRQSVVSSMCEGDSNRPTAFVRAINRGLPGYDYETEGKWSSPFYFVQASDIQLGMINSWRGKSGWDEEMQIASQFVKEVNNMQPRPKFVLMSGDLVNALPDDKDKLPQEEDFRKVFSDLDPQVPFICMSGNHDLGQVPTAESIQHFSVAFGDEYFSFWMGGVKFIVINTQYYVDSSQVEDMKYEHDRWFEEQLLDAETRKSAHVVLLAHIPFFHAQADEEDDYFNIPSVERKKWLRLLKASGVKTIVSGHTHRNGGGTDGDLRQIVTTALGAQLGNDGHGYRIIRCFKDRTDDKFFNCGKSPTVISLESEGFES